MRKSDQIDISKGLYDASYEHDACGVGMLVNIHGGKSHELVESALKVLENMRHRGAEGADNKTGDGAGILLQIPHEFILLQGIPVPEKGKYGTGLIFLPKDTKLQDTILSVMIDEIEREGLTLMHLRKVPVNSSILGREALATEPDVRQVFITGCNDQPELERKLYFIRKRIEKKIRLYNLHFMPELLPAADKIYNSPRRELFIIFYRIQIRNNKNFHQISLYLFLSKHKIFISENIITTTSKTTARAEA